MVRSRCRTSPRATTSTTPARTNGHPSPFVGPLAVRPLAVHVSECSSFDAPRGPEGPGGSVSWSAYGRPMAIRQSPALRNQNRSKCWVYSATRRAPVCASPGRFLFTPSTLKSLSTFFIHSIHFSSSVKTVFPLTLPRSSRYFNFRPCAACSTQCCQSDLHRSTFKEIHVH